MGLHFRFIKSIPFLERFIEDESEEFRREHDQVRETKQSHQEFFSYYVSDSNTYISFFISKSFIFSLFSDLFCPTFLSKAPVFLVLDFIMKSDVLLKILTLLLPQNEEIMLFIYLLTELFNSTQVLAIIKLSNISINILRQFQQSFRFS